MSRRSTFSTAASFLSCALAVGVTVAGCSSIDRDGTQHEVSSETACAEPSVEIDEKVAKPGATINVRGSGWLECNDVESPGSAGDWTSVEIVWIPGDEEASLEPVKLSDGAFETSVSVPESMPPGQATLRVTAPGFRVDEEIEIAD